MQIKKKLLSINAVVWLNQILVLLIYFWIYAKKGLPSNELLMTAQAICIVIFFESINRFKLKYDSFSKTNLVYFLFMIFLNYSLILFFSWIWNGFPWLQIS